jgi:hypothetical protein
VPLTRRTHCSILHSPVNPPRKWPVSTCFDLRPEDRATRPNRTRRSPGTMQSGFHLRAYRRQVFDHVVEVHTLARCL